jgi:hypothetical protein
VQLIVRSPEIRVSRLICQALEVTNSVGSSRDEYPEVMAYGGVDWITLAQDMGEWRALLNLITNLRVS